MTTAFELLSPERIACHGDESSRKRVLQRLAGMLDSAAENRLLDGMLARERLGSTAIGSGVALPHTRCTEASHEVGALLILDKGIDYDAPDQLPCDIFFALSVPDDDPALHLETLAALAETFHSPEMTQRLRQCHNADDVLNLLDSAAPQARQSA